MIHSIGAFVLFRRCSSLRIILWNCVECSLACYFEQIVWIPLKHEAEAVPIIRRRVARGSIVHADEARAWDDLHASFEMKRIDHGQAYSANGACTNQAESYFSRLRRAEIGQHHHIA